MNSLLFSLEDEETREEESLASRRSCAAQFGRWVREGSTVVVDLGGAMPGGFGDVQGEIVEEISSPRAVIDSRIDSNAQQGLLRLAKAVGTGATAILAAVKGGQLGGIYQHDHKVPALLARSMKRGGSQLIPPGADAAVVARPGASPILVFHSSIRQDPRRLDAALLRAWGLFNAARKISMKGLKRPTGALTAEISLADLLPFPIPVQALLPRVRQLDAAEIAVAKPVFGSSLQFNKILVSDALGLNKCPFTLALPFVGTVLNMGLGPFNSPASDQNTLIHELAHSWQSQHHLDSMAYEANSLMSQAQAKLLGENAYCYIPGKRFQFYAAEQIAQSVENGFRDRRRGHEAAIIAHIRSVNPGKVDAANVLSLAITRTERPGGPGVVC